MPRSGAPRAATRSHRPGPPGGPRHRGPWPRPGEVEQHLEVVVLPQALRQLRGRRPRASSITGGHTSRRTVRLYQWSLTRLRHSWRFSALGSRRAARSARRPRQYPRSSPARSTTKSSPRRRPRPHPVADPCQLERGGIGARDRHGAPVRLELLAAERRGSGGRSPGQAPRDRPAWRASRPRRALRRASARRRAAPRSRGGAPSRWWKSERAAGARAASSRPCAPRAPPPQGCCRWRRRARPGHG